MSARPEMPVMGGLRYEALQLHLDVLHTHLASAADAIALDSPEARYLVERLDFIRSVNGKFIDALAKAVPEGIDPANVALVPIPFEPEDVATLQ